MSEPIILEDYIRDSEELDTTENYSLVLVRPTLVVEGVLVNYTVIVTGKRNIVVIVCVRLIATVRIKLHLLSTFGVTTCFRYLERLVVVTLSYLVNQVKDSIELLSFLGGQRHSIQRRRYLYCLNSCVTSRLLNDGALNRIV